jgi:hypothetical protein
MRALAVSALLLLASGPVFGAGDSLWCGQRIVKVGDPIWQVGRYCPDPFWQESYDRPAALDRWGRAFGLDRIEVWTINFGPSRFMRRLEFVNGRLSRVKELGYGVDYEPGSRRCGPYELGKAGNTIAEVFARCGRPDYSYEIPEQPAHGYWGWARHAGQRQVWTYDFGPRQQARELLFIDGRLSRISIP